VINGFCCPEEGSTTTVRKQERRIEEVKDLRDISALSRYVPGTSGVYSDARIVSLWIARILAFARVAVNQRFNGGWAGKT
jgi:hypothetical protein